MDTLLHLLLSISRVLVWLVDTRSMSPSVQEMLGAGLLCLVMQVTFSVLFSVTVKSDPGVRETAEDCIEMEDGGTVSNDSDDLVVVHIITYLALSDEQVEILEHPGN